MKVIKYLLFTVVLSFIVVILTGCITISFVKEKTFTNEGLSITLTNRFYEKEYIAFTSCYESENMMVIVIKEDYNSLLSANITKNTTIKEYLDLVIIANNHKTSVKEEGDILYFDYSASDSGKDFKYIATAVKGTDAFYLVQFCVIEDTYDKLQEDIFKYVSTIETE